MESLLKCLICHMDFDLTVKNPRILPCNQLICLKCVMAAEERLGGFLINCSCFSKTHKIRDLNDLYPCELIENYLSRLSDRGDASKFECLKNQIKQARFSLNVAKYEANKHYDTMEMNIDIRAESLINFIHDSREALHKEIKSARHQTNLNFEAVTDQFENDFAQLEAKLEPEKDRLAQLMLEFNRMQSLIEQIKKKSCHFTEQTQALDTSLLGFNLSKSMEKNYFKIKNLNTSLADRKKFYQVHLKSQFVDERLRHYVIPLNRKRILSVYFTVKRKIVLELFDSNGDLIKTIVTTSNASYYPIFSFTDTHFLLCYIATPKIDSQDLFGESVSYINLYDTELREIKSTTDRYLIESIYLTQNRIFCTYAHKTTDCCRVYDYDFNVCEGFGQQSNCEAPFYFEKAPLDNKDYKAKLNPVIFGFHEDKVYFYTKKSVFIMCKKSGRVLNKLHRNIEKTSFVLDSESNLIEFNLICKSIKLFNFENNTTAVAEYENEASEVFLIEDNYFAFVDMNKKFVTFV